MNPLEKRFPGLGKTHYAITSPPDADYNCLAWAAGFNDRWWEPDPWGQYSWPQWARRTYTLEAATELYAGVGFEECLDGDLEKGFEKVAIFSTAGLPVHAARQLESGRWTSKLGEGVDIEHELAGLEGDRYGTVAVYMRRER